MILLRMLIFITMFFIPVLSFAVEGNADVFKIFDNGTAFVKGQVTGYTNECEVDGACSLIVKVNEQKVYLVYAIGDMTCKNLQAAQWGSHRENLKNDLRVKAYGAYKKDGDVYSLYFCNSKDYFILGENDPLPMDANTKKFFEVQ